MRRRIFYLGIAAAICFLLLVLLVLFIYEQYEEQMTHFVNNLWIYALVSTPFLLLLGIYLFLSDLWSIISILAFGCVLTIVVCGYLFMMIGFSHPTSAASDKEANPAVYLYCVFAADAVIVLLMIASVVQHYCIGRRTATDIYRDLAADGVDEDEFTG